MCYVGELSQCSEFGDDLAREFGGDLVRDLSKHNADYTYINNGI